MNRRLITVLCVGFTMLTGWNEVNGQQTLPSEAVHGPDFKITTQVFAGDSQTAICANQTLFKGGLVFDFQFAPDQLNKPLEISIYDSRNHNFVLLDIDRKYKLKLDNLQLLRILDGLSKELISNENVKHLGFRDFEAQFDIEKNHVTVFNDFVSYSAQGKRPDNDSILPRYFEFLDQYTLVSATDPHRMPPFARMRLNQSIKKYGFIPERVTREAKGDDKFVSLESRHQLHTNLKPEDLVLIENAKRHWVRFETVDLAKYRRINDAEAQQPDEKR